MGLKYYMRGLGVGIVVTTLIMGILTGREKETLSDDEIRERARALGMTEQSQVLADSVGGREDNFDKLVLEPLPTPEASAGVSESPRPSQSPEPSGEEEAVSPTPESLAGAEASPTPVPEAVLAQTPLPEPETLPAASISESEETVPEPTPVPIPEAGSGEEENGEIVTIEIVSGDGSFSVSKKLEEAGVVASAAELDTYLCQNGYDKRIRTGRFEIPADADMDKIARILVRSE